MAAAACAHFDALLRSRLCLTSSGDVVTEIFLDPFQEADAAYRRLDGHANAVNSSRSALPATGLLGLRAVIH